MASALIEYKRPAGVTKAIAELNGSLFKGRKIVVALTSKGPADDSEQSTTDNRKKGSSNKNTKQNAASKEEKQEKKDAAASQATSTDISGNPVFSLYVRNLSFKTTEDALRAEFGKCGEIVAIRLPIFEDTGMASEFQ